MSHGHSSVSGLVDTDLPNFLPIAQYWKDCLFLNGSFKLVAGCFWFLDMAIKSSSAVYKVHQVVTQVGHICGPYCRAGPFLPISCRLFWVDIDSFF